MGCIRSKEDTVMIGVPAVLTGNHKLFNDYDSNYVIACGSKIAEDGKHTDFMCYFKSDTPVSEVIRKFHVLRDKRIR